jgi:hypothetical protein
MARDRQKVKSDKDGISIRGEGLMKMGFLPYIFGTRRINSLTVAGQYLINAKMLYN